MPQFDVPGLNQDQFDRSITGFQRIADRFASDPAFRAEAARDASAIFKAEGIEFPAGLSVRLVADTPGVMHVVLPPDPNNDLSDEALGTVAGGSTLGSAGSLMTASSVVCSSAPSSASTASSSGTASSVDV